MGEHLATTVDEPIFETHVDITGRNGDRITESVQLSLSDFALDDLRVLAYWEEADPEAYALFASGEISVADFGVSALRLRAFLYALTRGKVTDSRIRDAMTLSDFTMRPSEIQAIAQILEDADSLTG